MINAGLVCGPAGNSNSCTGMQAMSSQVLRQEILAHLNEIFREVFDDETLTLTESTSAEDIPQWDSLMHVTLCIAVEQKFQTRLNALEIAALDSLGDWVDLLAGRQATVPGGLL